MSSPSHRRFWIQCATVLGIWMALAEVSEVQILEKLGDVEFAQPK
jgi:hypothetical protein